MATYQGEQFGQRRPPLSVTIKSILERYPDGQIFKVKLDNVSLKINDIFSVCAENAQEG